jgi:hypothetical protein
MHLNNDFESTLHHTEEESAGLSSCTTWHMGILGSNKPTQLLTWMIELFSTIPDPYWCVRELIFWDLASLYDIQYLLDDVFPFPDDFSYYAYDFLNPTRRNRKQSKRYGAAGTKCSTVLQQGAELSLQWHNAAAPRFRVRVGNAPFKDTSFMVRIIKAMHDLKNFVRGCLGSGTHRNDTSCFLKMRSGVFYILRYRRTRLDRPESGMVG